MNTWQQHLKKCAAEYQQMKLANKNAQKAKARTKPPPYMHWPNAGFAITTRVKIQKEKILKQKIL